MGQGPGCGQRRGREEGDALDDSIGVDEVIESGNGSCEAKECVLQQIVGGRGKDELEG